MELSQVPAGSVLTRCHPEERGPLEFNPSDSAGRFRPVWDDGVVVPSLYAGVSDTVAIWETVLHDVGSNRPLAIPASRLDGLVLSRIRTTVDLTFAVATDPWVRKWGVSGADLSNAPPRDYAITGEWATAIYGSSPDALGIAWISRQLNTAHALVMWESRVPDGALELARDPRPLAGSEERRLVLETAEQGGITVVIPA